MKGRDKPNPSGYIPPSNPEAEQSVLGALLVRPELLDDVSDLLRPEDFYREAHANIYRVMLNLYDQRKPVDLVTVSALLKEVGWLEAVGGPVFLAGLSEQVGFATNVLFYASLVRDKAMLRRLLDASQEIAGQCLAPVDDVDSFIDQAENRIFQIKENREVQLAYALESLVPDEAQRIEAIFERKREILGIPSGFVDLDSLTSGWQNGDLVVIAARPSMGKTAMAINMGHYAAKVARVPTGFFSMEQPKEQLVQRLLASTGQINATRLRSARMESREWASFQETCGDLLDVPIHIIDKPAMTTLEIRSGARRLKSRQDIGLMIVDYLQLARDPKARSREQEVGSISRSLKALAKELNIPIIALCQLNREVEKRPGRRPNLSDLRESGSIEQDADLVIFIYRDEFYNKDTVDQGVAEITLAKQRNGPTGLFRLTYRKEFMLFQNYIKLY
jgi:replicative DNA helicase